jgi:nucleoside recognition membrane protein YjiH
VEKQVMYHISKFIKQQWLGSILIVFFFLFLLYGIEKKNDLLLEKQRLEKEIKALEQREQLHWNKFDSLKLGRNTIIEKQKTLIRVEHDTVKIIDTIAFSKLQEFFSKRYSQKDSVE